MDCSAEEDVDGLGYCPTVWTTFEVVDLHREYWDNVAAYAINKIKYG